MIDRYLSRGALIVLFDETLLVCVGTGDSPLTIPFYEKCGFVRGGCIPNFFTDHYDHEIWEEGVLLRDMILLTKTASHM